MLIASPHTSFEHTIVVSHLSHKYWYAYHNSDSMLLDGEQNCLGKEGIPQEGQDQLLYISAPIAKSIVALFTISKRWRPDRAYDPPFLSYNQRVGFKFVLKYDEDYSRAAIDGRLSAGFDPQDALKKVHCPMQLLQASGFRHPMWGLSAPWMRQTSKPYHPW
jgi:hypothetical protein